MEERMRLSQISAMLVSALLAVPVSTALLPTPTYAAEDNWFTYGDADDRFAINLPGQPTVEESTYTSEFGSSWPARVHTLHHNGYIYRMTAANMTPSVLAEEGDGPSPGFEKRGAMAYAATTLRGTGEVILDTYDQLQVIPGHKLEVVLPDGSLNLVALHTHHEMLYILECISPQDALPGYEVQSSLELLNADTIVPRYENEPFPSFIPVVETQVRPPIAVGGSGWVEHVSPDDRFAAAFPAAPSVEAFTYTSAQYSPWSARRYSAADGDHQYTLTVVDMSTSRLVEGVDAFRNTARPGSERAGAPSFAAANFRMAGDVTVDRYIERQAIPGHRVEAALPDGRRSIAEIFEHHHLLYIVEHILPAGAEAGFDIHASLQLLDEGGSMPFYLDGNRTFPDYITMTGDGTNAAGRDLGAILRGEAVE